MTPNRKKNQKSQESKIRVIAGKWRSRKLDVIDEPGLRPTGDRLRETLFNWLAPHIRHTNCLDLFAGTGALGIEALSREAKFVQFVETNPRAYAQIKQNLQILSCNNAAVANSTAENWCKSNTRQQFDLIFLDPPFDDDLWQKTIQILESQGLIAPEALVYIETPKEKALAAPESWSVYKQKQSGQICATLYATN